MCLFWDKKRKEKRSNPRLSLLWFDCCCQRPRLSGFISILFSLFSWFGVRFCFISFRFVLIFSQGLVPLVRRWNSRKQFLFVLLRFLFVLVGVVTVATVTQWMRMTKKDLLQQVNKVTKSTTTVNNRGGEGPWGTLLLPFLAMITRNPPLKSPIKCLYGNTHPAPCGKILRR